MKPPGHVLVVDDEVSIAEFIAEALTEEGYVACIALDAAAAFGIIAAHRPDLVLCDLHMPGVTGTTFVQDLLNDGLPDIPVVIMTADVQAAQSLEMDGVAFCLRKPFDLDDLFKCVAQYIRRDPTASTLDDDADSTWTIRHT
jgi:CheY-like chemotaxis protein